MRVGEKLSSNPSSDSFKAEPVAISNSQSHLSYFIQDTVKNFHFQSPAVAQLVKDPTSMHEDVSSIPCFVQWFKDLALLQALA